MEGTYILLLRLDGKRTITVGRLGAVAFRRGWYCYVGSALNGLEKRIGRHLRSAKRRRWHIDYLLDSARIAEVYAIPDGMRHECPVAGLLAESLETVRRFGSSDCRCPGHLFHHPRRSGIRAALERVGREYDLRRWRGAAPGPEKPAAKDSRGRKGKGEHWI